MKTARITRTALVLITALALIVGPVALVLAGTFGPVTVTDQTPTAPLANPVPSSYQPRYVSGFGGDDSFTVFFEDRDAANTISYASTTTGPTGFPASAMATNIADTHFVVKDWPINIGGTDYAYRAWGSVGNNMQHHFYVSNNLINWPLVSTFTIPNALGFTDAHGWVYYGFHDVIQLNGTYYAFAESNQSQTMIVRSANGDDVWEAFDSVGGRPGDGPLELPAGVSYGWTPSGSFVDLGHDRGYGKIHVDPRDSAFYLAVNTAAKPSLPPADLEAAFINPANWTWHDGSTGPAANPILSETSEHDLRECWVVPNSNPDADWVIIYDADFGSSDGGKALGYATLTPPSPPPATVYVDDDYDAAGCTADGHTWQVDCFDVIQDGVDAVAVGGTVNVAAGTYAENVIIHKDSLTVQSVPTHAAVLDGSGQPADYYGNKGFWIQGDRHDVIVDGFEITGYPEGPEDGAGIFAGSTASGPNFPGTVNNITLRNNIIHDNGNDGIQIDKARTGEQHTGIVIENNEIYNHQNDVNMSAGIKMYDAVDGLIAGNTLHTNERGILFYEDVLSTIVEYNHIYNTTGASNGEGIKLDDHSEYNVVRYNYVYDSPHDDGIRLDDDSNNNEIYHNTIYNNAGSGIFIEDSSVNNVVRDNIVALSGEYGIEEESTTGPFNTEFSNLFHANVLGDFDPDTVSEGSDIFADPIFVMPVRPTFTPSCDPLSPAESSASDTDGGLPLDRGATQIDCEPTAICLASFTAQAGLGTVTLAWETATEVDNAGFNLYRAMVEDGPYSQINDGLIAAEGDPVSGASYSFADRPDYGTFYYKLEDVDYYGVSTLHGSVRVTLARPLRRPLYRPTLPTLW